MAKKARPIEYDVVDDLDGKALPEGTETTTFSLGGTRYKIDLSAANVTKLNKALDAVKVFTDAAEAVGSTPGRKPAGAKSAKRPDLAEARAWAKANGWPDLADRGRIPADALAAFDAK